MIRGTRVWVLKPGYEGMYAEVLKNPGYEDIRIGV